MKTKDLVTMAWRNLLRRKSRAFLTIFSVVIGIFSIILMLSFGYGIQISQENFLREMVSFNAITLYPTSDSEGKQARGQINEKVLDAIKKDDRVESALGKIALSPRVETRKPNVEIFAHVYGVDFSELDKQGVKLSNGRPVTSVKKNAFLIDPNVKAMDTKKYGEGSMREAEIKDFPWEKTRYSIATSTTDDPLQAYLGSGGSKVSVSYGGRLDSSSKLGAGMVIPAIYIDRELAETIQKKWNQSTAGRGERKVMPPVTMAIGMETETTATGNFSEAVVMVRDINDVEPLTEEIKDKYKLSAYSMKEGLDQAKQGMLVLQVVLGAIGGVSLFVAAIGITNTMLMSIQERTKEIGVMKVIGAQVKDVRKLFLLEAALIGMIGGLIGIIISLLVSTGVNHVFIQFAISQGADLDPSGDQFLGISYIPFWLPFLAVFFSAFVGLVAGYLPARRATNISAIEAIRTE